MSKKIAVLPLDERPCNYRFNQMLVKETDYEIISPNIKILGNKKTPGDLLKISDWLMQVANVADVLIIAIDTLVYGGIVPSRLHNYSVDAIVKRLSILKSIKQTHPQLKIYAYNLIMRNPNYSSAEEEPDYYETCGREIHLYGVYQHKKNIQKLSVAELTDYKQIKKTINPEYLNDYLNRRKKNIVVNKAFLTYVSEGIIDFGVIPQDDSSKYGLTATDQMLIRETIESLNIELDCYMYPGADEVANTLLARCINKDLNFFPKFHLKYSSINAGSIIPLYEDRYLSETIKYQILCAGGIVVSSETEADIILLVNAPSTNMKEAACQNEQSIEYDAFRNLIEYVEYANYAIEVLRKPVIIADVAYGNGGDLALFKLLKQKGILFKISAYAGWNTSSNTLGTCISQGIIDFIYPTRESNLNFLGLRYVEDIGYCSIVRQQVSKTLAKPNHYFSLDGKKGLVVEQIKIALTDFAEQVSDELYYIVVKDVYSPWNRMFEIGIEIEVKKNTKSSH